MTILPPSAGRIRGFRLGLILISATLISVLGSPAWGQRLPLPPEEQSAVDRAIDRGVKFLKATAQKNGTWARFGAPHQYGYAALPGLTLLECDVPLSDPILQHTAHCLRSSAATLDTTYELSLAILFLDRLGEPKDRKIIQTFALRLIAGQSATGGWGYKCPILGNKSQLELLTVLRHLNPPAEGMPGIARGPNNMPGIARGPGNLPDVVGDPSRKPGDLGPVAQSPGGNPVSGHPATSTSPSLSGTTSGGRPAASLQPHESTSVAPSLWRDWLGFSTFDGKGLKPGPLPDLLDEPPHAKDAKEKPGHNPPGPPPELNPGGARPGNGKAANGDPAKPFVIPERLRMVPVIQDPDLHLLVDPVKKGHDLIVTTTDNSNTQFAILALWTAQRHGVPMNRTLNLIVRRYMTSQNGDGTWSYHYIFGGGLLPSPPMTCVGLIGLAVGHGIANHGRGGKPVQDPRILNGLVALSRYVGKPTGQMVNLPMQNLYFLWSVERVAVLYDLPKIGDKDWYRWVRKSSSPIRHSRATGSMGCITATALPSTRAWPCCSSSASNLVKDLTSKLPFNPADLNDSVLNILVPSSSTSTKPAQPSQTTTLPASPPRSTTPPPDTPPTKPPAALDARRRRRSRAPSRRARAAAARRNGSFCSSRFSWSWPAAACSSCSPPGGQKKTVRTKARR